MRSKGQARPAPLLLASLLTLLLACFLLIPWVRTNARLAGSFLGAASALLLFQFALRRRLARTGRTVGFDVVPRPVHYVQLCMHTSIYLYWGWYWREVYHYAPLILAQIVYVYVLDMLVCWWRRDQWVLGFGPFPIVLSTNLFLWFKDDWFFLQFLLVSTGVLCKELIAWNREGRRVHIFNPSAIALAIFSLGLIVTHSTQISWAEEVAVTLGRPPNIYIEIFLVGMVVQALFSVTLVTLSAAATLYLLNLIYTGTTGVYYFVDSNIPAAVFLGLHLLVTDPATSPRRYIGKTIFGALYGTAVFGLYSVLAWAGAPTFYDKLLCVPPLNLTVRWLDRVSLALEERIGRWNPAAAWSSRKLNFAHMGVWIALFGTMALTGFVGPRHPGGSSDFWQKACQEGRRNGCETWVRTLDIACQHQSVRACVTLGTVREEGRFTRRDPSAAAKDFGAACDLGRRDACVELVTLVRIEGPEVLRQPCDRGDAEGCFILASLYYGGSGVPKDYGQAVKLFRQSCGSGWARACGGLAECYWRGQGTEADPAQAIAYFEKACRAGIAASCYGAAQIYRGTKDEALAQERFRQACDVSTRAAATSAAYFKPAAGVPPVATSRFCKDVSP